MAAEGGGGAAGSAMPPPPPRAPLASNGDAADFSFPTTIAVAAPVSAEAARPFKEPLTARSTVRRAEPPAQPGGAPVLTAAARLAQTETRRAGGGGAGVGGTGAGAVPGARNKVFLEKGYSQVDWLRLTRSGGDLTGGRSLSAGGISLAELREHGAQQPRRSRMVAAVGEEEEQGGRAGGHRQQAPATAAPREKAGESRAAGAAAAGDDAPVAGAGAGADAAGHERRLWMALHGRVYDVTAYLPFHPGGAQILEKAAGTDATALFRRYHPWVNAGALLEACCLGRLGTGGPAAAAAGGPAAARGGGGGGGGAPAPAPAAGSSACPAPRASLGASVMSMLGRGGAVGAGRPP